MRSRTRWKTQKTESEDHDRGNADYGSHRFEREIASNENKLNDRRRERARLRLELF